MASRRSTPRCSPTTRWAPAQAPTGCACASRRGKLCLPHLANAGMRAPASPCSTASAPTEMFQTYLSNRPDDIRYGSTGKPVPGYEIRIVDESGREVADGEVGELVVRGTTAG